MPLQVLAVTLSAADDSTDVAMADTTATVKDFILKVPKPETAQQSEVLLVNGLGAANGLWCRYIRG